MLLATGALYSVCALRRFGQRARSLMLAVGYLGDTAAGEYRPNG